jgi:hypothetical protein
MQQLGQPVQQGQQWRTQRQCGRPCQLQPGGCPPLLIAGGVKVQLGLSVQSGAIRTSARASMQRGGCRMVIPKPQLQCAYGVRATLPVGAGVAASSTGHGFITGPDVCSSKAVTALPLWPWITDLGPGAMWGCVPQCRTLTPTCALVNGFCGVGMCAQAQPLAPASVSCAGRILHVRRMHSTSRLHCTAGMMFNEAGCACQDMGADPGGREGLCM